MKKFLAFAVCAAAAVGTSASAQQLSATADVVGTVEYPANIEWRRDLDFGEILRTAVPQTIEINGGGNTVGGTGQTAHFYITGDVGDLVNVFFDDIVELEGQHQTVVAMFSDEVTPHYYQGDVNTNMMTLETHGWFRYVTEDEQNKVDWFLPTWLAGDDYYDDHANGHWEVSEDLPPGVGQINLFVGGTLNVADDQQRGEYIGVLNASVEYF